MGALILDGKALGKKVRSEAAQAALALRGRGVTPGLAVLLVGDDPASDTYVRSKTRALEEAGLKAFDFRLPATTTEDELTARIAELNSDSRVHGILVQLPLPRSIDTHRILEAVSPDKDVDGFHPVNVGRLWSGLGGGPIPCTPAGIMRLLGESGIALAGATAVVIGRSNIVGKPVAALLLQAHATVTLCHSKTRDLAGWVNQADVVIAALGRAEAIRGEWIKPGAVVIDVGINRTSAGKLVGDVEFDAAAARAKAITPVPGGVGPMTIAMLVQATVDAARRTPNV